MEKYLSANDAARILDVTAQSVHLMVRRGELRVAARTESGIHLFRRADVEALAVTRAARPTRTQARPTMPEQQEDKV